MQVDNGRVFLTEAGFGVWEEFVETATHLQEQLRLARRENAALRREINSLIMIGRFTEQRVAIAQEMYHSEVQACALSTYALYGVGALSLIFLGAAAL